MTLTRPGRRVVTTSTRLVAATGAACLLTTVGGAYALWSVSGSGSAAATVTTPVALTVSAVSLTGDLYPGRTGAATLSVQNPNVFPVSVSAVLLSDVTSSTGACSPTHLSVHDRTGLSETVAAGATRTLTLAGAVTLASAAPDACQGAVFTMTAAVTGSQS